MVCASHAFVLSAGLVARLNTGWRLTVIPAEAEDSDGWTSFWDSMLDEFEPMNSGPTGSAPSPSHALQGFNHICPVFN